MAEAVKYIRVIDTDLDGNETRTIQSVTDAWREPESKRTERYEVVTEEVARSEFPPLFGVSAALDPAVLADQIAALQELLAAATPAEPAKPAK